MNVPGDTEIAVLAAGGAALCPRCRVARTPIARLRGLVGRRRLAEGEGLLLARCHAVHTTLMLFPVEAVFLAADGEVLRVARLAPWRAASHRGAHSVLELAPGSCAGAGVLLGDRLRASRALRDADAAPRRSRLTLRRVLRPRAGR